MDAIFNFGLRFAQASESKVRMTDRLLMRETVERIATGMRLISQAIGFSIFGTLVIANRHQAWGGRDHVPNDSGRDGAPPYRTIR
jgi:hypothetical protein